MFTVTRNRSAVSSPIGCSAIDAAAPVWTLEAGASSSGMRLSRTYAASRPRCAAPSSSTVMSSTIRTPCPSRSAPHHWMASQIDGSPNASPAWMVKWKFCRWRYSNASRWRVGGKPASAPAMSKPTTPSSRHATASSAISRERAVPHRGQQLPDDDPAAARRPCPRRTPPAPPRRPGRATGPPRRAARGRSGPRRTRRRPRPGPRRTRAPRARCAASVCITATVWSNVSR